MDHTLTAAQAAKIEELRALLPSGRVSISSPPGRDGTASLVCESGRRSWITWLTPDGRLSPHAPAVD